MNVIDGKEYKRFGEAYCRREVGSTADWEIVQLDDLDNATLLEIARYEGRRDAIMTSGLQGVAPVVTRSTQNQEIAAKLGLTADELAEKLATNKDNEGTKTKLSEEEFDAEMAKLGLSPEEARARFKGTFFNS